MRNPAERSGIISLEDRRRQAGAYKLYTISELLSLEDDPNQWIIPNMIPRGKGKVVIYGHGGQGKSTIIDDMAVAVASGGLVIHQFPVYCPGRVLLLSTEGNKFTNRNRLAAMLRSRALHPSKVDLLFGDKAIKLQDARGRDLFHQIVERLRPLVIVLDPYRAFFSGDENSTRDTNAFTDALDEIQDICGSTVVIVHHSRKDGEIRGNVALYDWADVVMALDRVKQQQLAGVPDPVDVIRIEAKKVRDGQEGPLFCAVPFFDKELGITTFGWFDGTPRDVARVWLMLAVYRFLQGTQQAFTQTEIQQQFRVGAERAREALQALAAGGFAAC
ncbi:MAG: AAA family ATPase, partial [Deltaproteobacteria bacterium]|nr:AAA family ATPase [Deltaproteobacteria bacterium]